MNEIEKLHRITYDSIDGYYVVHTDKCPVYFHKNKQGLPYIDLDASVYDASTILVQTVCRRIDIDVGKALFFLVE